MKSKIVKVISGGQTGADMGGLQAACFVGLPTGGWAPRGWQTELGPRPELLKMLGLTESHGSYPVRTKQNIDAADFTIIIAKKLDRGSALTYNYANRRHKQVFYFEPSIVRIDVEQVKLSFVLCLQGWLAVSSQRRGQSRVEKSGHRSHNKTIDSGVLNEV